MAEKLLSHIKKYNPSISHYRWAHAPNWLYISPEHNVSSMCKDFIACYLCEVCELHIPFERGTYVEWVDHIQSTDRRKDKKVFPNCAKCETFQKHIETTAEAWSSYQNEKIRIVPSNELVVSIDMQKVIMLPRLPGLKQAIFCKCLVLFNETFKPIGKSKWNQLVFYSMKQ